MPINLLKRSVFVFEEGRSNNITPVSATTNIIMSIRLPLKGVLDYNDAGQTGATSVAGGVALPFQLPQDTDNVVVKLTASVIAGGVSATFQTTDDGGITWYDVARTSIVSDTGSSILGGGGSINAEWMSIPTMSGGVNPQVISTVNAGSVLGGTIGRAAASTLGSRQVSGLPILSVNNRIFLRYTAAVSSTDLARVVVKANNQDAGN